MSTRRPLPYVYEWKSLTTDEWNELDRTCCLLIEGHVTRGTAFVLLNFGDFENDRRRIDLMSMEMTIINDFETTPVRKVNVGKEPPKKKRKVEKKKARYSSSEDYSSSEEQIARRPKLKRSKSLLLTDDDIERICVELEVVTNWKVKEALEDDDICPICIDPFADDNKAYELDVCKHIFHKPCLVKWYNGYVTCPVCSTIYGTKTGFQPQGTMTVSKHEPGRKPLAGFEKYGTYTISYNFPNGIQTEDHPSPGASYSGTHRTAYLPDTEEGREVLELFKIAFDRKLIFRVGRSVTTGQNNTVVWNGIHMKTNTHGGTSNFGYPDDTYFFRVKEELAGVGVVPDTI